MPLSIQGNEVLSKMWDAYYNNYVDCNPGCNANDVERAFLFHILGMITMNTSAIESYSSQEKEIETLIEKIR